ncbi:MAG TPA: DUF6765 family protein [Ramlibacter sp.]|nr:DUF6765 family protein [Ramlibacter sp.]
MQIDMHYYGTYCLALAAGLKPEVCKTIATASQYVDDNASSKKVNLANGALIDVIATAHTTVQLQNLNDDDQRLVWVPFHFLPGAQGDSLMQKLVCVTDSPIAQQAIKYNLSWANAPFAVELVGVTAHVYADTFSHYGFSGISSPLNKVHAESIALDENLDPEIRNYITGKAAKFFGGRFGNLVSRFGALQGAVAERASDALGHGSVATYPDRPYLKWQFDYEEGNASSGWRENPATYLAGCRALHDLFRQFAALRPDLKASDGKDFDAIAERVNTILRSQLKSDGRIQAWTDAVNEGVFDNAKGGIPAYEGDAWTKTIDGLEGKNVENLGELSPYRFHQAAEIHRTHVLRVLLPANGVHIA